MSCFDVFSSKPNLVVDLKTWLLLMMFIGIFLIMPLHFFEARNNLSSNVCQPHDSIFSYRVHNLVHLLNVKPEVQTMIGKKRCLLCWRMNDVIVNKLCHGQEVWLIILKIISWLCKIYYSKTWLHILFTHCLGVEGWWQLHLHA